MFALNPCFSTLALSCSQLIDANLIARRGGKISLNGIGQVIKVKMIKIDCLGERGRRKVTRDGCVNLKAASTSQVEEDCCPRTGNGASLTLLEMPCSTF